MNHFFVVGLPRCRTSWLSAYLTWGKTFCHHDLSGEVQTPVELVDRLNGVNKAFENSGSADTGAFMFHEQIGYATPNAKWVAIRRDPKHTEEWMRSIGMSNARNVTAMMEEKLGDFILAKRPMVVEFDAMDMDVVRSIAKFIDPEWSSPQERDDLFNTLRIQPLDSVVEAYDGGTGMQPKYATPPHQTQAFKEYSALLRYACGGDKFATEFCDIIVRTSHVWDHLVDGDAIPMDMVDQVFQSLCFDMPTNPFVRANAFSLVSAMKSWFREWKSGTRVGAFQVYASLPVLVAAYQRPSEVEAIKAESERIVAQLIAEDDLRDRT